MEILERIHLAIEAGHLQEIKELIVEGINQGMEPAQIISDGMIPAMRKMGDDFKEGKSDIPHVLTAARCMRKGYETLEENSSTFKIEKIGSVILGTVEGDLHDVGKNLVAIMFRSVGFDVIDLGVDVSEKQFLKAIQKNPDVSFVCVSSLLTTALPEMTKVVKALNKNPKRKYKIMVGGGAMTEELARQIGADAYTENAVDAAQLAKSLAGRN